MIQLSDKKDAVEVHVDVSYSSSAASLNLERSTLIHRFRSGLCGLLLLRVIASAHVWTSSAVALALTSALATICGACQCTSGAARRVVKDSSVASLIRDSDGSPAILVSYVTGQDVGSPPFQVDAFYFAAWADGMVLHRPNFTSEHLFLLHVESEDIRQKAQDLYTLVASVPEANRFTLPPGEFDSTVQIIDHSGKILLIRGETAPPNSARERALHAIQSVVAHYMENFVGQQYAGDPPIRWLMSNTE